MPVARFVKICLDAVSPAVEGRFWAAALGLTWQPDRTEEPDPEGGVFATSRDPVLRIKKVPEPKAAKNRVHLDIYAAELADLEALGGSVMLPEGDDRRWTVMADAEGGEFCAFVREPVPQPRLHGLVVDCADPVALAAWWVDVLGGVLIKQAGGYATADEVPGMSFTFDFVPVPEPKTAKNRVHWDIAAPDLAPLLDAGARLLRGPTEQDAFSVLADPEGNEFCVFPQ
jgi:Glyoxalase-like domain